MKVALTGATGHLGAAILQELAFRKIPVKALMRGTDTRAFEGLPVEIVQGDLQNETALGNLMQGCDAVIHSAALISVNGDHGGLVQRTNVEGTQRVADSALRTGIKRFIQISSIHAYQQKPSHQVLDENSQPIGDKGFAYHRSKQAGKKIVLAAMDKGMEVMVMHPTSIVGPYDHKPSLVGKMMMDIYAGKLPFIFNGGFDFCDVRDVAHAVANSLTMGKPGEAYLLAGKWYSLKHFVEILSRVSDKKRNVIALPGMAAYAGLPIVHTLAALNKKEPLYTREALDALFNGNRYISSEKAMSELNYSIRPIEETIADTFHWFRAKGYL